MWDQCSLHGAMLNQSNRFRAAQFIKMFPSEGIDKHRLDARSATIWQEISKCGFVPELTELGAKLFGVEKFKAGNFQPRMPQPREKKPQQNKQSRVQGAWGGVNK